MDIYEKQELEDQKEQKLRGLEADLKKNQEESRQSSEDENLATNQKDKKSTPGAGSFLTAFTEINLGRDADYFIVIVFSIVADVFSAVPFLGAFTSLYFSVVLYCLYLVMGQLKNRAAVKVTISSIAYFLESFGGFFLISFLPLFTFSAILVYWIELSYRKANANKR